MNAKRCDRCGEFYTENKRICLGDVIEDVCLLFDGGDANYPHDLCDKCIEQLEKWLANKADIVEKASSEDKEEGSEN